MISLALSLYCIWVRQGHYERAMQELEAARYGEAWREIQAEEDLLRRSRGCAEILYRAGDPHGALEAAEEGLNRDPWNLELLYRATSSALLVQDSERALELSGRLESVVTSGKLASEYLPAWEASSSSLHVRALELERHERARQACVSRGQAVSLGLLSAAALALIVLGAGVQPGVMADPGGLSRR